MATTKTTAKTTVTTSAKKSTPREKSPKTTDPALEIPKENPPFANLEGAPYPTKKTLRHRRALVPQFFKFLGFNTSIMRMVIKGHGHSK